MYYEEKIIHGILCWRGTPDGYWIAKTPAQLTQRIKELEEKLSIIIDSNE